MRRGRRMPSNAPITACQWRSQGFQSEGVKGEGTGGGVPSRWGPGALPPEKLSNCRCTQASFSAFSIQKSVH
jgi:hypothetical protein